MFTVELVQPDFLGVNTDSDGTVVLGRGFRLLRNAYTRSQGLVSMPDWSQVAALSLPAGVYVRAVFQGATLADGSVLWIQLTDGTVIKFSLATLTPTTLGTMGNIAQAVSLLGWTFFLSPQGNKKTNGSALYNFLLPQPPQPTVTVSGSGNLNGTYRWAVAFVAQSSGTMGELVSRLSLPSAPLSVSNQQVTVTVPTSTDPQVTARLIYRVGGTLSDWHLVGRINDNTTTTFVDNNADANISTNEIPDFFRVDMPSASTCGAAFGNRLWCNSVEAGAEPTRVFFSEVGQPALRHDVTQASYQGGYIDVAKLDGYPVQALVPLGAALVVLKTKGIYILTGDTPETFDFSTRIADLGVANALMADGGGGLGVFNTGQHLYVIDGSGQLRNLTGGSLETLVATDYKDACVVFALPLSLAAIIKPTPVTADPGASETSSYGGKRDVLLYDFLTERFVEMGNEARHIVGIGYDARHLYFVTRSGYIHRMPFQMQREATVTAVLAHGALPGLSFVSPYIYFYSGQGRFITPVGVRLYGETNATLYLYIGSTDTLVSQFVIPPFKGTVYRRLSAPAREMFFVALKTVGAVRLSRVVLEVVEV